MHTLVLLNQHIKLKAPSFTDSTDMTGAKLKNGPRDPDHAH